MQLDKNVTLIINITLLAILLCTQRATGESPLNLVEGSLTRFEKREGIDLVYEVLLEKAVIGEKTYEGKAIGPIICNLGQRMGPANPEPPLNAKKGDRHIWVVTANARGQLFIRDPLSCNTEVREALSHLSLGLDAARDRKLEITRRELLALLNSHSAAYFYSSAEPKPERAKSDAITLRDIRRIFFHVFSAFRAMPLRDGKSELEWIALDKNMPLDVRLLCFHQWLAMIPKETKIDGKEVLELFHSFVRDAKSDSQGVGCGELFTLLLSKKELLGDNLDRLAEAAKTGLSSEHPAAFRRPFADGVYAWDLPPPAPGRESPVTDAFLSFLLMQLEKEKDEQIESVLLIKMAILTLNESQLKTIEASMSKLSPRAQTQVAKEIDLVRNPPKPKNRP